MKAKFHIVAITALVLSAGVFQGCGSGTATRLFDKRAWNEGRQISPDLNVSPWMVDDLLKNHLTLGMTLTEVTDLLGHPEIRTSLGAGVRIRGEFLQQRLYVYRPGLHNGWLVHGTNSLTLYFGDGGKYLKEWSLLNVHVEPVSAAPSEATRDTLSNGGLHIGNLRFAGTISQIEGLLGAPDDTRTECQLDYFLGKRTRLAWDDVFLELHFDKDQKLARINCLEH